MSLCMALAAAIIDVAAFDDDYVLDVVPAADFVVVMHGFCSGYYLLCCCCDNSQYCSCF